MELLEAKKEMPVNHASFLLNLLVHSLWNTQSTNLRNMCMTQEMETHKS